MGKTEAFFASLGYPPLFAWGDITLETIIIISLILGLYVRSISLLALVILVPAMEVWIPSGIWANRGGYEFPLLWIFLQVVLAFLGSGPLSLKTLSFLDKQ